jgi:hypothetical protein
MSNELYRLFCSRKEAQTAPLFVKSKFVLGSKREEGSYNFGIT